MSSFRRNRSHTQVPISALPIELTSGITILIGKSLCCGLERVPVGRGIVFGATRIQKRRMRFSFVTNAAAVVAGLTLSCLVASSVAVAKRAAVPLPDVNPNRSILPVRSPIAAGAPGAKEAKASEEQKASEEKKLFDARGALEPLLKYKLAKKDRDNLKSAINAVYKGRYPAALGAMKRISDRSAHKLALWYYYRSSGLHAKAADIEAFRIANPHWPGQTRLKHNAERSLFVNRASTPAIKAFFAESGPNTGGGKAALAAMHLAEGEKAKAKAKIGEAWRNYILTKKIEKLILERFPGMLTDADHKTRVDKLLYQDRKSKIASALRAASHLSKAEQKKIAARVAIVRRSKTAGKLLKDIPAEPMKADIGFYFSRIQWLRRRDKDKEAWELLQATPNEPSQLLDLNEWWIERRVNARRALNAGHPETAYEIASNHGPITGKHYAEAQFLAGWIMLRFLDQHENAEKHFLALRTSALTPKQIARAEYWLGPRPPRRSAAWTKRQPIMPMPRDIPSPIMVSLPATRSAITIECFGSRSIRRQSRQRRR